MTVGVCCERCQRPLVTLVRDQEGRWVVEGGEKVKGQRGLDVSCLPCRREHIGGRWSRISALATASERVGVFYL